MRWLTWNVSSGKLLFCKKGEYDESATETEIRFLLTHVNLQSWLGSLLKSLEPSSSFSDCPLTFTDLFKNMRIQPPSNPLDNLFVIMMDVEPKCDVLICDDAYVNEQFQNARSVQFYLSDLPHLRISTERDDMNLKLHCQFVIL